MTYRHRRTDPLPGPRAALRLLREGGARPTSTDASRIPLARNGDLTADGALTWVGHATYLVRLGGRCVLTDPVWSARAGGLVRRLTPPGVPWSRLPRVDAVTLSHDHYDHLDAPTVRGLRRDTAMLVPAGLGRWFRRRGFTRVYALDWWESVTVDGLRYDFVPAHHWSGRGPGTTYRSLWGGWVITAPDGTRVHHAGDSGYGRWFAAIGQRYPGIDVAMLPIGAYAPRWFMAPVHMDPAEAVRAFGDLGARRFAAMHWGTFPLTAEPPAEPPDLLRAAWAAAGHDRANLWDLAVGETRRLAP